MAVNLGPVEPTAGRTGKNGLLARPDTEAPTTLYFRSGLLISVAPKNPDDKTAEGIADVFTERFSEWEAGYKGSFSPPGEPSDSDACLIDNVRRRWELTTLVVDYPCLRNLKAKNPIEARSCLAICTGKASCKVWSRVAVLSHNPEVFSRVSMGQVRGVLPYLEAVGDCGTKWMFDRFAETWLLSCKELNFKISRRVKATVLGINDPRLKGSFEELADEDVGASGILKNRRVDEILSSYSRNISSLDRNLSEYDWSSKRTDALSCKIRLWAELEGGDMAQRAVVFFMRDLPDFFEVIGLAYDDSVKGDIGIRAGAKLSKVIGPWI